MKLNDFFEKVFVINLERRPDRLEIFEYNASQIGFEYEVFKAFDGRTIDENFSYNGIPIDIKPNVCYRGGLDNYSKSQLGCVLSHLEILKMARDKKYESILILEDDVAFVNDFINKFYNFYSNFNKDWDMIYFSGSLVELEDEECGEFYKRLKSCHTTHSYSVNKNIYDFLIKSIEENIYISPIDVTYTKVQSLIKSYITIPFLAYQSAGFSDIQNKVVEYLSTKTHI
jgi:glycosyl transferase family 25